MSISPTEVLLDSRAGERLSVAADFVLLLTGYEADMRLFEMAGVELAAGDQRPAFDRNTMATNVPGLFVAGTATAGTQASYRVFIENCHIHAARIVAAIEGRPAPPPPKPVGRPES